jgi:hypothetical protein
VTRTRYSSEDFGNEVAAPSGYYVPLEEGSVYYNGKRLLYVLGTACMEASCCGIGSWQYARVEGYVVENDSSQSQSEGTGNEIETIVDDAERKTITKLLLDKHPGARIEFR